MGYREVETQRTHHRHQTVTSTLRDTLPKGGGVFTTNRNADGRGIDHRLCRRYALADHALLARFALRPADRLRLIRLF